MCRLVGERIHLLPPFRWKLAEVPFGLDHPYWIEDPDFDLDFHIRETAVPPPGDDRQLAELVARIVARPLDRARPLWELYLIHGLEGGRVATAHEDPPRGRRRRLGRGDPQHPARPRARGPRDPAGAARATLGEREPGQLEMLGRGLARPAAPAGPRARRGCRRPCPNLADIPGVQQIPGVADARPRRRARRAAARQRQRRTARSSSRRPAQRAAHALQRRASRRTAASASARCRSTASRRSRTSSASPSTTSSSRSCATGDARVAARARRAARRAARRDGPGVGAHAPSRWARSATACR